MEVEDILADFASNFEELYSNIMQLQARLLELEHKVYKLETAKDEENNK